MDKWIKDQDWETRRWPQIEERQILNISCLRRTKSRTFPSLMWASVYTVMIHLRWSGCGDFKILSRLNFVIFSKKKKLYRFFKNPSQLLGCVCWQILDIQPSFALHFKYAIIVVCPSTLRPLPVLFSFFFCKNEVITSSQTFDHCGFKELVHPPKKMKDERLRGEMPLKFIYRKNQTHSRIPLQIHHQLLPNY